MIRSIDETWDIIKGIDRVFSTREIVELIGYESQNEFTLLRTKISTQLRTLVKQQYLKIVDVDRSCGPKRFWYKVV